MKACGFCGAAWNETEFDRCPGCTTQCADCGTLWNTSQLTMCPECRATKLGEVEFPKWIQQEVAAHNRRVIRNRWLLGGGVVAVIILAIMILG